MNRHLRCKECGTSGLLPLHDQDAADGWKVHVVGLWAKKPANLNIVVITGNSREIIPLTELLCDLCNAEIKDGEECVAITMYQGNAPENWEQEYGEPL